MFADKSRYARVPQVEAPLQGGGTTTAIKLRRLPPAKGEPHVVKDSDRLDLLAQQQYGDGTRFWHIADANSALDARRLAAVTGESLDLPKP